MDTEAVRLLLQFLQRLMQLTEQDHLKVLAIERFLADHPEWLAEYHKYLNYYEKDRSTEVNRLSSESALASLQSILLRNR